MAKKSKKSKKVIRTKDPKITPALKAKVMERIAKGEVAADLAREYGLNMNTVYLWRKNLKKVVVLPIEETPCEVTAPIKLNNEGKLSIIKTPEDFSGEELPTECSLQSKKEKIALNLALRKAANLYNAIDFHGEEIDKLNVELDELSKVFGITAQDIINFLNTVK